MNRHNHISVFAATVILAILGLSSRVAIAGTILNHLSSMCPYKYAKNGAKVPYTPPAGGQCKLVSVEGLFRHGTRQPTTKYMGKISGTLEPILEKYRDVLKLQWMKEWDSPYVPSVGGLLSPLGVTEAYDVGSRITKYFKSAFIPYNPNEVIITPSGCVRTSQTAAEFGRAMLGGDYSVPLTVVSDSMDHDNILYFHNNCQRWINEVKRNKSATEEAEKFLSAHIQEVGSHISAKTGIPAEALTNDVLSVIWGTCQSDVDVFDDTSMWCSLFSERDAAIMEYHDDLEAYYSKGYAYPLNHRMAALLFQDIVSSLEASKACSGGGASKNTLCVRSNLRFAHAETLIPFLVGLGLYKDKKAPTAEWTEAEIAARQWRLEDMVPMLGSAVLLQYSCEDDETYLDFYHNEMVTPIPGCNNTGKNVDPRLCPLSRFKEIVKDYLAIDWHQICDLEEK